MTKASFQKNILPHILAVAVLLAVAMVFCYPSLQGKTLSQSDVISHTAMARQSVEFKEKHGHYPFWSESMFSGMPTYNIAMPSNATVLNYIVKWFLIAADGGFRPIALFFLASVCFYILTQVFRIKPWIGVLASIGFAYCTFDPIIVAVGHNTQMAAIGFMPAVVAGVILLFERKYIYGAALLTIALGLQCTITQHIQIVYYTMIILGLISLAFLVKCWREKSWQQAVMGLLILIGCGIVGLCTNAVALLPLQEYAKETVRGGRSELSGEGPNKTRGGLDKDYAFTWSYGVPETMTVFIPSSYGGGSAAHVFDGSSKLAERLQEIGYPEADAIQAANYYGYWGDQGGDLRTAGPVYFGAVICFLFVLGLLTVRGWHSWWIIGATIFGFILAWGRHFSAINYFLFDHLPFYNKFRAPSMALVIPQLTVSLMAGLGLNQLVYGNLPKDLVWKKFRTTLYIMGALLLIGVIFYFMADFKSPHDSGIRDNISTGALQQLSRGKQPTPEMQQQATELGNSVVKAMQTDRQALMGADLLRTLLLVGLAIGLVWFYLKEKLNQTVLIGGLLLLSSYDLLAEGKKYLSDDNFGESVDTESYYTPTAADQKILADPDQNFRVYDLSDQQNGPFNSARASYFHNSIGGYHPAKLGLYQDLIEHQIGKGNMNVLNMLNTRYFIQPSPSNGQPQAVMNPAAYGPVWLVNALHYVNTGDEEMKALDSVNTRDTAIVLKKFEGQIKFLPVPDSTARIRLAQNLNDIVRYEFSAKTNQFAVFSEIYYDKGWNAYLDGKRADYVRVDYVLRGMAIPAGDHKIEFRFEPATFQKGETISWIASIIGVLLLLAALWQGWRQWRNSETA